MCCCLLCAPYWGTCPTIQACVLTWNQTGDLLVPRPALSPLSHTSQGSACKEFEPVTGKPGVAMVIVLI